MIWIRRIVFYLFLTLYLLVCPATIFYSLGFYFKPGTRTGLVRTGLIYISTEPSNADITINGGVWRVKSPAVIRNLLPGFYKVKIEAEGYQPWSEDVPVEAERASVLEKILLLPRQLPIEEVRSDTADELFPVPRTSWMLLSRNHEGASLLVYDSKKETSVSLAQVFPLLKNTQIIRWFFVPKSSAVLVEAARPSGDLQYFQIFCDHPKASRDISRLFRGPPDQVIWADGEEHHLGAWYSDGLDHLRADKMLVTSRILDQVQGAGVNHRTLYVLRRDHTLAAVSWDGKQERMLLRDAYLGEMIFGKDAPYQIYPMEDRRLIFWGPQGQLISNRLPHVFASGGIQGFDFARRSQKLVVWTSSRIGILDLEKETDSEEFFQLGPHIVWLYSQGKDIRQAVWIYDDSQIVFRDSDQVFFLDLETFSTASPLPLFTVYPHSAIGYSETTGAIYFIDAKQKRLHRCALAPRHELISIPFPGRPEKPLKRKRVEL